MSRKQRCSSNQFPKVDNDCPGLILWLCKLKAPLYPLNNVLSKEMNLPGDIALKNAETVSGIPQYAQNYQQKGNSIFLQHLMTVFSTRIVNAIAHSEKCWIPPALIGYPPSLI